MNVMEMASSEHTLLEEVLPHYDVSTTYSIRIRTSSDRVYRVLQEGIPSGSFTKILMALRGIPRLLQRKGRRRDTPVENAFYKLKHLENRELVIGIIGQFWKAAPQPVPIHSLEEFVDFRKDGYCKAALNLRITPKSRRECVLVTETRVLGYGSAAKQHFKSYWKLIGPFSGIIRREILRKIKYKAEHS